MGLYIWIVGLYDIMDYELVCFVMGLHIWIVGLYGWIVCLSWIVAVFVSRVQKVKTTISI